MKTKWNTLIKGKTKLLEKELLKMPFTPSKNNNYETLNHGTIKLETPFKETFRDSNKNLWINVKPHILISYSADKSFIDQKDYETKTKRLCFSATIHVYGTVRPYRCKSFYSTDYFCNYIYDTTLEGFIKQLKETVNIFNIISLDKNRKEEFCINPIRY